MNLRCDGFALSEAILKVIKATPIKKNNSLLEGIKLSAEDGYLTLTATDMELTIIKKIVADIKIEGEVLVMGKMFAEYVKSIEHEEIELDCADGKNITVKYGENEVTIKCMDVLSYPAIDEVDADVKLEIKKEDLKDVISKTAFSASVDEGRPILKGCLFEIQNDSLTVVSLDGYRLSLCRKNLEYCSANSGKYVIPARSLSEIQKFIDESDDNITLLLNKDKLYVNINNTIIITRLINGEFPGYKNIITTGFTTVATFNRNEFYDSIRRATIMTKEGRNNLVKLEIKDGAVNVESNGDLGNVYEIIKANVEGKENTVCFNGKYLLDFLNVTEDEFIKMNIKTSSSPCIFNQVEGEDYLFLILPMRITY